MLEKVKLRRQIDFLSGMISKAHEPDVVTCDTLTWAAEPREGKSGPKQKKKREKAVVDRACDEIQEEGIKACC